MVATASRLKLHHAMPKVLIWCFDKVGKVIAKWWLGIMVIELALV